MSAWIVILWILAIFVAPIILGQFIARATRMKDDAGRFSTVLVLLAIFLAPFASQLIHGEKLSDAFRLGIDLAGGTNLVYQADTEQAEESGKEVNSQSMDELVRAITRRVNPSGTEEVTVRQVGDDRVEIIIPGADPDYVQAMKKQITNLGSLEFGILASRHDNQHQALIARAEASGEDVYDGTEKRAQWVPVARTQTKDGKSELKDITGGSNDVMREREVDGQTIREFLIILDPPEQRVDGSFLVNSRPTMDPNSGISIGFTFNAQGGFRFQNLTNRYQPKKDGNTYRLAAILDGKIHSAPNINAVIAQDGIITGDFTNDEVTEMVSVLNSGALELPLVKEPISEYTISPLLGVDVQEKGKMAITVAAITVLAFMLIYYWMAGVIANLSLIVNVALILGAMALFDATFTLPGLAGLVLTIGMAVDANVLIFERMREELEKGSSLRLSIHNGFSKAFSTIIDANLTTLITAVILYARGTEQVKGFAALLIIGIIMSMFSALYFGRLMFDLFERMKWLSAKSMLGKSMVATTSWDYVGKQMLATIASLALIIGGMAALISRGNDNLDIDFTGGSMVTFQFQDNPGIDETRESLQVEFGNDMTVERLVVPGIAEGESEQIFFRLRTKNEDTTEVRKLVNKAFETSGHELTKVSMEYGDITSIPADPEEEAAEGTAAKANADLFAGGSQVKLTFSDEVTTTIIEDEFKEAYAGVVGDDQVDDENLASLFTVTGIEGSGVDARESAVRRFSAVELKVRKELPTDQVQQTLIDMQQMMAERPVLDEVNTFSSAVAGEAKMSALMAILMSLAAIIGYVWFRFQKIAYGLAAVVALVHDVLCVLGLVAIASLLSTTPLGPILGLVDFKINLPMIAAFLTIIGYSLNDTIVVFDRIREVKGKNPELTADIINRSLNQTLSRTLLTSFTTLIVVAILYVLGGEGLHGFAFCLVTGVAIGTYSSIYVASPVLLRLANPKKPAPTETMTVQA